MKTISFKKTDCSESLWETLCESALGYPIDESYELLDVVSIHYSEVVPCEPKFWIGDKSDINGHWVETTREKFRKS